jgi:hypothetical protein
MSITTFPCPIPRITDPLGAYWDQPEHSEIQFTTDGYAVVSDHGLAHLKRYDSTTPSGEYPGKMWMRFEDGVEYLCWYIASSEEVMKCEVRRRKILHKRVIDLITQANDPQV